MCTFFAFHRGTLRGNYGDQSQIKTTPPFICDAGLVDWESLGVPGYALAPRSELVTGESLASIVVHAKQIALSSFILTANVKSRN